MLHAGLERCLTLNRHLARASLMGQRVGMSLGRFSRVALLALAAVACGDGQRATDHPSSADLRRRSTAEQLLQTGDIQIIGSTDEHLVYRAIRGGVSTLAVVPLSGGEPIVLATVGANDAARSAAHVVGFWTETDEHGIGNFNVWSRAHGLKRRVATGSTRGHFDASEDGERIAFTFAHDASRGTVKMAVSSTSAPATEAGPATAILEDVNILSQTTNPAMFPAIMFKGRRFILSYAQGVGHDLAMLRLVKVEDQPNPMFVEIGQTSDPTQGLGVGWRPDRDGKILFALGAEPRGEIRIFDADVPEKKATVLDPGTRVSLGWLSEDGQQLNYLTHDGIFKRCATREDAVPVRLLDRPMKHYLTFSNDRRYVIAYTTTPPGGSSVGYDFYAVDSEGTNQVPLELSTSFTGLRTAIGFDAAVTHAYWVDDASPERSGTLRVRPLSGGPARAIADQVISVRALQEGTRIVFARRTASEGTDLQIFDVATSDPPVTIATDIHPSSVVPWMKFEGATFLFTRSGERAGAYAVRVD
jgi:hypothetical protein